MKKVLASLVFCLAALYSCQKEPVISEPNVDDEVNDEVNNETPVEVQCFYASLGEEGVDLRTTLNELDGKLSWAENDAIAIFRKQNVFEKHLLDATTAGSQEGKFAPAEELKSSDVTFEHNVAVYPYSEEVACSYSNGVYEVTFEYPATQVYNPALYANGLYSMVAVSSDENLRFKNVGGALKLLLKGDFAVETITVTGNLNEPVAGEVVVKTSGAGVPEVQLNGTETSVTLLCNQPVQLNESEATPFYIVMPEVEFTEGFTVAINNSYSIRTNKPRVIERSGMLTMNEVVPMGSQPTVERHDKKSGFVVPGSTYDYSLTFTTNDISSIETVKVVCSTLGVDETINPGVSVYLHEGSISIPSDAALDQTHVVTVTATNDKGQSISNEFSFTVVEGKVYLVGGASISKGKLGKTPAMTQNPENLNEFSTNIWADEGANWFKFVSSNPDWSAKFNFGLNDEGKIINDGGSATIAVNQAGYHKVTFNMATWEYIVTPYEAPAEIAYPEIYITGQDFKYLNENGEWSDFSSWSWLKMNPYPGNPHRFYIDIVCYKSVLGFAAQANFDDGGTFFGIEGGAGWNWVWWEHVSPLVITNTAGSVPQLKEDSRNGEVMRAIIDTHLGVLSWIPASEYTYPTPATF